MDQVEMFGDVAHNDWKEHWQDMPEYDNVPQKEPEITALFKFKNYEDFELFNELLKKHVYKTSKVFDGMQRKDKKSAWFPLPERASKYLYE